MLLFFNKFREVSLRLVITSAGETCCCAGHGLQESWRLWIYVSRRFMWIYFSFAFQSQTTLGIAFSCFICLFYVLQMKDLPERSVICFPWPPSSEGRQQMPDGHRDHPASPLFPHGWGEGAPGQSRELMNYWEDGGRQLEAQGSKCHQHKLPLPFINRALWW